MALQRDAGVEATGIDNIIVDGSHLESDWSSAPQTLRRPATVAQTLSQEMAGPMLSEVARAWAGRIRYNTRGRR